MAPQRPIGFWLKLLDELINDQFARMLEEHGVTRRQWQMMGLLSSDRATRVELEQALEVFLVGTEPDSLIDQLTELLDSGWVASVATDTFALTEQGRTSFARLGTVVARNRETLARGVSSEEYTQTLEVLERMARNLGWSDPVTDR